MTSMTACGLLLVMCSAACCPRSRSGTPPSSRQPPSGALGPLSAMSMCPSHPPPPRGLPSTGWCSDPRYRGVGQDMRECVQLYLRHALSLWARSQQGTTAPANPGAERNQPAVERRPQAAAGAWSHGCTQLSHWGLWHDLHCGLAWEASTPHVSVPDTCLTLHAQRRHLGLSTTEQ